MKKSIILSIPILAITASLYFLSSKKETKLHVSENQLNIGNSENEEPKKLEPHDQWLTIRSYPDEAFNQTEYLQKINQIKTHATSVADSREVELSLDWKQEGPGNIGGRIDVLTVSPTDQDIIYAGATNGGIFKTTNGGETWNPIFDDQPYLAIGAITLDPDNENIIYAGTGDRNFTGSSFIGNGVYKSINGGETWESSGLEETGAITEIIIDPTDNTRIFASTLGNPHVKTTERGIYRSEDAGSTWENILFLADSAGIADLIMDPSDPDILYATGYDRMRNYYASRVTGPHARIYKTVDGGDSWTTLSGGLPAEDDCRIGLAISNDNPDVIYALYVDGGSLNIKEIYKTSNAGSTWEPINVYMGPDGLPENVMGGFGWYFGEVYLNPFDNDQLIVPGVEMFQSLNGGDTWARNVPVWWTGEVHADKHAIAFLDENSYIIATDGGLYKTDNNGSTWEDIENIPITQFYHIATHPHESGLYGGGAQDNGSMSGNAESFNEWERLFGGDGFRVTFLELDEGAAYFETQNGGIRYSSSFGDITNVSAPTPGDDRTNWDTPYKINESTGELFIGTAHIQLMSEAPYGVYEYISEDLTRIGMGEAYGNARFQTISEIDQPYDNPDMLYAGTTDGLVWRGERSIGSWEWTNITGILPNRYVTGVVCSPNLEGTVYVTLSGYKDDEGVSYLFKTTDFGETWTDISSDLPGITVNDILIVPGYDEDEILFAALDGGVYFSQNGGGNWDYVGVGLPFTTVNELRLDALNMKLIAGTYSRSMWSYDISWLEEIEENDNVGISEEEVKPLNIYPNPVKDILYLEKTEGSEVLIYNQQGKLILRKPIIQSNNFNQVDLSKLNKGIYYIKVGLRNAKLLKI